MSTTLLPDEERRATAQLAQISQSEADERTESYVQSVLADIKPHNLTEADLSRKEVAHALRQSFYAFLAANYEVVA